MPHPDGAAPQLCGGRGTKTGCTCTLSWVGHLLTASILSFLATNTATGRYGRKGEGGSQDTVADQGGGGQAGTRQPRHSTVTSCPRGRQEVLQEGRGLRRGRPALCVEADPGLREARGDTAPLRILLPSGCEGTVGARVCRGGCPVPTPRAGRMLSPGRKHTRCSWSRSCHRQDLPARGRRRRCRWRSRRPCGTRPRRAGRRLARGS